MNVVAKQFNRIMASCKGKSVFLGPWLEDLEAAKGTILIKSANSFVTPKMMLDASFHELVFTVLVEFNHWCWLYGRWYFFSFFIEAKETGIVRVRTCWWVIVPKEIVSCAIEYVAFLYYSFLTGFTPGVWGNSWAYSLTKIIREKFGMWSIYNRLKIIQAPQRISFIMIRHLLQDKPTCEIRLLL